MSFALLWSGANTELFGLALGDEVPWFTAKTVLQHGPTVTEPFVLERYRGGVILLICWEETGAAGRIKFKYHQELEALRLEHRDHGVLILGISAGEDRIRDGLGETGLRGPVVVVEPETLLALGPIEQFKRRRMVIDGAGTVVAEGNVPDLAPAITKALAERTPYGRWATLAPPYFHLVSTVAKVSALQKQINDGDIGSALDKARRYAKDTDDRALSNEAQFVVTACETWIATAASIEADAMQAGDPYTASLVAAHLAKALSGVDEADAAKARLKTITSDPAYKIGKTFHETWAKTWTMPADKKIEPLRTFAKKYPDSYYAGLVEAWHGKP